MEGFLVVLALIALIPAAIASSKGYSFFLWWLYGCAIWIVAFIHSLCLNPKQKVVEATALADGGKKCPNCAEIIKAEARTCRFCGHIFYVG